MGNFIAKAYINNYREIIEEMVLIEQLEKLGYEHIADDQRDTIIIQNGMIDEVHSSPYDNWEELGYINCRNFANGDEDLAVKLFLALAEMRDGDNRFRYADLPYFENGIGRTIERGEIIDTKQEKWNDFKCKELYTELTPKQLAEAVRDGKITKEQLINK